MVTTEEKIILDNSRDKKEEPVEKRITIKTTEQLSNALDEKAAKWGITKNDIVNAYLLYGLRNDSKIRSITPKKV